MAYARLQQWTEAKKQHFRKAKQRLQEELDALNSLERSPGSVVGGGVGGALGGAVGRALSGQPVAGIGDLPFKERFQELFELNQTDFFDDALGKLNPLAGQIFSRLTALTSFDPNRALFDLAQRATGELERRLGVADAFVTDLVSKATSLRDEIATVLPTQGDWFSDATSGFRANLLSAVDGADQVRSKLDAVLGKLNEGILPRQSELDELREAATVIREDLVPLNADLRPGAGVDHPQADVLTSIAKMKRLRDSMLSTMDALGEEHRVVTKQRDGVANYLSDENTRTRGATMTRELTKTMRRFDEYVGQVQAQISNALGSSGVGEVFNRQEEWITKIEGIIGVLDRPLLQLGPTSEDGGGAFDTETAAISAAFDSLSTGLGSIADFDLGPLEDKVNQIAALASSSLTSTGLSISDLDDMISDLTNEAGGMQAFVNDIQSAIDGSGFMSGIVPKLDQVTSYLDTLKSGGANSAAELLTSGALFRDGISLSGVRSIDFSGLFAEELRVLAADPDQPLTELNLARVEKVHRVLEVDERRRKRLAQSYEDAIELAKTENELRRLRLEELERDSAKIEEEIST